MLTSHSSDGQKLFEEREGEDGGDNENRLGSSDLGEDDLETLGHVLTSRSSSVFRILELKGQRMPQRAPPSDGVLPG